MTAFADPRLAELGRRWLAFGSNRHRAGWSIAFASACAKAAPSSAISSGWNAMRVELNGVSFTKGCFVGQENTARMNWRQKVNRRLVVVEGDGGERSDAHVPGSGPRIDAIPKCLPPWLALAVTHRLFGAHSPNRLAVEIDHVAADAGKSLGAPRRRAPGRCPCP